jgi:hypothetical protein
VRQVGQLERAQRTDESLVRMVTGSHRFDADYSAVVPPSQPETITAPAPAACRTRNASCSGAMPRPDSAAALDSFRRLGGSPG